MSDRKRNILETCVKIGYFGEANPELKTEVPYSVELFLANQNNIDRLNQAGITLVSAKGAGISGTRSKVARAEDIEADLRMVAKTGRLIEEKDPTFKNTFVLPRGRLNYDEIIQYTEAFLRDAPANQERFDKYALKDTFFTALTAKLAGFREVAHDQADGKRTGVGANAEQEAALKAALDTRKELDRAMKNHFRNDPEKLAEWQTASHIRKPDETPTDETPPEQGITDNG
ncbi:MAG TPA: hypothetical protein PKY59_21960 [Pyrinomonadaceae bacterium]|nr:hypothetical protein [Pyrinomonadaceae bacterium]